MTSGLNRSSRFRVQSSLFRAHMIALQSEDLSIRGWPADISATGLGVVVLSAAVPLAPGARIEGSIYGPGLFEPLRLSGIVRYLAPYRLDARYTKIGVEFEEPIIVPQALVEAGLVAEAG